MDSRSPNWEMPALFTSTCSAGPTCSRNRRTSSSWATSQRCISTPSTGSGSMSAPSTLAPRRANARAMARPMPRAAPVTATTLPANVFSIRLSSFRPEVRPEATPVIVCPTAGASRPARVLLSPSQTAPSTPSSIGMMKG
ncbi:hypothetical protein, serine-rich [Symbiobacterium thermophilum IAM 14863]|uniref:Uncharacterized protein n=1 Tax=Symbiobacterium thermophilum (strain DSM 24528 / JCM 14929 / IAM 14863 / T) TaxID=292459 RepID=Q67L05_SYMTH|nr:hypothetical protein, serine-rich [Symbiobacterium thermophilum IAM 14863]